MRNFHDQHIANTSVLFFDARKIAMRHLFIYIHTYSDGFEYCPRFRNIYISTYICLCYEHRGLRTHALFFLVGFCWETYVELCLLSFVVSILKVKPKPGREEERQTLSALAEVTIKAKWERNEGRSTLSMLILKDRWSRRPSEVLLQECINWCVE